MDCNIMLADELQASLEAALRRIVELEAHVAAQAEEMAQLKRELAESEARLQVAAEMFVPQCTWCASTLSDWQIMTPNLLHISGPVCLRRPRLPRQSS